jgi:hypothetical protein
MPRPKKEEPTARLNLELSETVLNRLKGLQKRSEADSMTEVIRRALAVYDLLLAARESDHKTIIRTPDGTEKELVII